MRRRSSIITAIVLACVGFSSTTPAQPSIEDFLREPDYRQAALSPSGRYLAQVWNRSSDQARIVTIRNLSDPGRPIVGRLGDKIRRPSSVSWANDERLLINVLVPFRTNQVERLAEKDPDFDINDHFMLERMMAVDVDAGNAVILMDGERGIRGNVSLSRIGHFMPEDPQHGLMPAVKGRRLVLFKVNVYSGDAEIVAQGRRRTFAFLSDANGSPLYRLDYMRARKEIVIFGLDDEAKWRRVDKISLKDDEEDSRLNAADLVGIYEDNLVYRKLNEDTGFDELIRYDVEDGSSETLASVQDRDILYPLQSSRSDEIVGYTVDGDVLRHRLFDADSQSVYDRIAETVGEYFFHIVSVSEDRQKAIVQVSGPDDPSSYYLYHAESDELEFLRHSHSALTVNHLSRPAMVSYKARDGQLIRAYGLLPADYESGRKYPLVVMPHGGPHARDRSTYDEFAQFISTRGYVVIKPNFRGSTGYGKAFEEAGYRQWGGLMQDDVADAVDYLVRQGVADPGRVCVVGISYGGYAALMGAVKTPDLYRCSVSINGVALLPKMIAAMIRRADDDDVARELLYERIGDLKADSEMLERNSPALHADKIQIPVLVLAGKEDEVVPVWQSRSLVKALERHDVEHRYIELGDAGHNVFRLRDDAEVVFSAVEDYLAEHLAE